MSPKTAPWPDSAGCRGHYFWDAIAVFSNAALHWMVQPDRVIAGVYRALRPGGRFVGEFGGQGNVASIVDALNAALSAQGFQIRNPWFFPSVEEYQRLLEGGGFKVKSIELIPRPTSLPGDLTGWLETFAHPFMSALSPVEVSTLTRKVADALQSKLRDKDGRWTVDYVRLRFVALKGVVS